MLDIKDFLEGNAITSNAVMSLALAVAREYGHEGGVTSFDGVSLTPGSISEYNRSYLNALVFRGTISAAMDAKNFLWSGEVDTAFLRDLNLFEEVAGEELGESVLAWDSRTTDRYGKIAHNFRIGTGLGQVVLSLVARYWLVQNGYVDGQKGSQLRLIFEGIYAKTDFIYLDLFLVMELLPWFTERLGIVIINDAVSTNLDYRLFAHRALLEGTSSASPYSLEEKRNQLLLLGYRKGGVYLFLERGKFSNSTPEGVVTNTYLARIEEISDREVLVVHLPETDNGSRYADYLEIEYELQDAYIDLTRPQVWKEHKSSIPLYNLAIDRYFSREDNMILPIDVNEAVVKPLLVNGSLRNVQLNAPDYVYWLLAESGIDFDREGFKEFYQLDEPYWELTQASLPAE